MPKTHMSVIILASLHLLAVAAATVVTPAIGLGTPSNSNPLIRVLDSDQKPGGGVHNDTNGYLVEYPAGVRAVLRDTGTDLFVSSFSVAIPWYEGVVVQISAQGQIGSGVACTGLTPPGGWSEANVGGDTNWPFHATGAHPYCLIGSLDRGSHWFFVGTGKTFALTAGGAALPLHDLPDPAPPPSPPPAAPAPWPPTRPLFFAVNRPDPTSLAIHADHQWDLVVTIIEPDWNPATMSWDNSQACPLVASQLSDTQGSRRCGLRRFGTAMRAVNDRWTLVDVAGGIASGCLIALVAAAAAIMAAEAAAHAGAQQSSAAVIAGII